MEVLDEKIGNGAGNPVGITVPDANKLQTMTDQYVVSADVHYIIAQADVEEGAVLNQAQLSYQYQSLRSKGQLATTSDAQASIIVHTSVSYRYESGTAGMQLPPELEAMTPTDYTYYETGSMVTVQPHVQSPFWDEANGGYWMLQNDGRWGSAVGDIAADGTFPMPSTPITLTATWAFAEAPAIKVEKDGSIQNAPTNGKEGDTVSYTAHYTLSLQNTGGEPLNQFTICDATLPPNAADIIAEIDGKPVTLGNPSYDAQTHTLTFTLPQELQQGETLVLSYSSSRTGTLGYKTQLTDESQADVTAVGTQTGVSTLDDATLDIQVTLRNVIILTPADIVIYAGGDENGNNVAPGTNLPEPGFFVTLPLAAEQALRAATGDTEQVDLSSYLTFTDANKNVWGLEPFCGEEYSKSDGHFLYRLVPVQVNNGQKKIEMQFYDEEMGTQIRQSEFDITNALQQEYAMTIYPGEIPAVDPVAVLQAADQEIGKYGIDVSAGKLMIRGTTGSLDTQPVADAMPETQPEQISVYAFSDDTEYYINQSELKVQPKNVALLVDHIVSSVYDQTLQALASDVIDRIQVSPQKVLRYQFRYLDLVDTSMGNTWVTASKPLKVIWPYPDGTDKNDDFTIIHYKGLDRDYNLEDMAQLERGKDYVLEVYTTEQTNGNEPSDNVTYHELTRTDSGLCFVADGFSPYVLIWEGTPESHSSGGTTVKPEEPEVQPEPIPDGLNTTDHYAYLIGRGDGGVQPLEPIMRAEIATIWFRLLTDETRAEHWSTAIRAVLSDRMMRLRAPSL